MAFASAFSEAIFSIENVSASPRSIGFPNICFVSYDEQGKRERSYSNLHCISRIKMDILSAFVSNQTCISCHETMKIIKASLACIRTDLAKTSRKK